ncbi:MAG: phosphoribosylanthranilate isomerase [Gemmatimonadota bacterium]
MAASIKICGLTQPDDAAIAAGAGASYLGVVFARSPRRVTASVAESIVVAARGIPVIGVFGGQQVFEILRVCAELGLAGAQLHTPYPVSVARRLRDAGLLVWRVGRLAFPEDLDGIALLRESSSAVLVEARVPDALGGTGVSLPLDLAREARARLPGHQMVLAGGLTAEIVAEAIEAVHPDIVDVSSGVELRPGVKDPDRIMKFIEAVLGHQPSR